MSDDRELPIDDKRLSDASARRLLERAIALDAARAGDTTVAELRRVAQELNISPTAFAEALRELESKAVTAPQAAPSAQPAQPPTAAPAVRKGGWWRTLAIGLGSFTLAGLEAGPARFGQSPDFSLVFMMVATLALLIKHRRDRTPGEFVKDITALFAGVTLPWLAKGTVELAFVSSLAWIATTTIGGFLVRYRWPWQRGGAPDTSATTT